MQLTIEIKEIPEFIPEFELRKAILNYNKNMLDKSGYLVFDSDDYERAGIGNRKPNFEVQKLTYTNKKMHAEIEYFNEDFIQCIQQEGFELVGLVMVHFDYDESESSAFNLTIEFIDATLKG